MEIVLLEDVKALGKKGQIVKVNDGYARNFILPKKLGVEANAKNLNDLKLKKANEEKVAAEQLAAAKKLAAEMEEMSVTVSIKAGEGGRTFGSVSTKEIAKAAMEQLKLDIDKKKMKITQAGLPKMVVDQTPKYMRWAKVPIVKAKIGPKVMTLMADERVFQSLPVKTEAKVVMSGIYITQIKSVRGGAVPAPAKKKGFFARFKRDKKKKEEKK